MADEKKVRLEDIRPSEINREIYNPPHEDRIIQLANNIKRNGLLEPLLVTSDGVIISGHTRFKALQFLKRAFVTVRYMPVHSSDQNFIKLLTDCNDQRDKTQAEKIKEITASIDPVEYIRRRESIDGFRIEGLESVSGELKSNRQLTENYKALVDAIVKVMEENRRFLPMPLRGIFYQLLNKAFIESACTGRNFSNSTRSYKLLSKVATNMRVNGIIHYDAIRDDKRKVIYNRGYEQSKYYLRNELDDFLTGYSRDYLQTQPNYIALLVEKETLSTQVNMVTRKYNGLPVIYMQGNSSITIRHKLMEDQRINGSKPIVLLFLSDLDPAGYRIQDSFVGSIEKDFGTPVTAYRVGITIEQVNLFNLHSDQTIKKSDTGFKKFVKETGLKNAYELEALPPDLLIDQLDNAIRMVIDMDLFNEQVQIFNNEVQEIEHKRERILNLLSDEW